MALGDFRSVFLPYCLKKQSDGRYAVLNREYKPVGFFTGSHVTYEDHPVLVQIKGLTKAKATKLSWSGSEDTDEIFLYNDGCVPTHSKENMRAYLAKLEILAGLSVA
ncbi:hypothetical protein AGMMS49543_23840 [Betaproteobacteria bacterium]|nr:hypothetical protein AGMMS49543_23840 [Betaproteobacteria bacterium]GHU19498.1 hypothetical protein AGMMS50243_11650 [Betaproteobacteria bacterium]